MKSRPTLAIAVAALVIAAFAGLPREVRAEPACQGVPSNAKLHLEVQRVRSSLGIMTATLYGDDPARWLKGAGELKVWREAAQAPVTEMCLWLPGPGVYGVVVYHDAKKAGRFVRGTFGPTQDYGFSRNPHLFLGPPSFNQVKFSAGEGDTTIFIRLKYP
jgi:uncharacterized protein (DUF2141 family)